MSTVQCPHSGVSTSGTQPRSSPAHPAACWPGQLPTSAHLLFWPHRPPSAPSHQDLKHRSVVTLEAEITKTSFYDVLARIYVSGGQERGTQCPQLVEMSPHARRLLTAVISVRPAEPEGWSADGRSSLSMWLLEASSKVPPTLLPSVVGCGWGAVRPLGV